MEARWWLAVVVAVAGASATARADTVNECIRASNAGQEARRSGKLGDAALDFAQCSRPSCPGAVRRECARWVEEVELAMPTVVFAATDAQGHDRRDVRVLLRGRQVRERPVAPIGLGGGAIAAFGVAAYFDVTATGDAHTLRATCDARCLPSDVD